MHSKRRVGMGMVWAALGGVCLAQAPDAAATKGTGCASTPAAAIEVARAGQAGAGQGPGFRVESVRWDAAQRQTWAIVRSCDHADRPTLALLTDLPHVGPVAAPVGSGSAGVTLSQQIALANGADAAVHAGQTVRLWRTDVQAHIELVATAQENGAVGARVRLRLDSREADGQSTPPRYLTGFVRGPADVEMEQ